MIGATNRLANGNVNRPRSSSVDFVKNRGKNEQEIDIGSFLKTKTKNESQNKG